MKALKNKIVAFVLVVILIFGSFSFTNDYFEISKNLDIFNSLYRELNLSYVDNTKPGQLMKTGIDAMLNTLDPYTVYYPENEIEDYRYLMTGEYAGIGASVADIDDKIIITQPYEGFAAFNAGIRAGDQIVSVNGISVLGKRSEEITNLLKGQAGTSVKLGVLKLAESSPKEITLKREEIKQKAVPHFEILPGSETGYIKLTSFTENCSQEVKSALVSLKSKNCKSVVLDLRGNPGGLLYEAVNIVNLFVDKGQEVVFTKGRILDWEKSYLSVNNPIDTKIPLIVLVDENSASASEIVSGALQDLDRAVILGRRTFGKGLVQQTRDLIYNTKVKITVAKYYIPSGRCVQALDYSNKNEDGRVEKVPDSLITAFKTKSGRIVYDGAGIMPDVQTKQEEALQILYYLINKNYIFKHANDFVIKNKSIGEVKTFEISDEEFNSFRKNAESQNFTYKTNTEKALDDLISLSTKEGYDKSIESQINELRAKISQEKANDWIKHKSIIKHYLEDEIIGRYYFQKGQIEFSLRTDKDIQKAIELFKMKDGVESILLKKEKATRPFNPYKKF